MQHLCDLLKVRGHILKTIGMETIGADLDYFQNQFLEEGDFMENFHVSTLIGIQHKNHMK